MHRDIIVSAFAKAKKEEVQETGLEGSNNKASERISAYISAVSNIPYSSRSLRNALNDASNPHKSIAILQPCVLNALCRYVGYENYQEYLTAQAAASTTSEHPITGKYLHFSKKPFKWIALVGVCIIIGVCIYVFSNRQRWMEWESSQYIEVNFNAEKLQKGTLKLYKKDRIDHFKKVILHCNDLFFDSHGRPLYWYGKNTKKHLEFFTDLGRHPQTGKTLKPITPYMIETHLCKE